MKKYLSIIVILGFGIQVYGQKRWAVGLSASVDMLFFRANPNNTLSKSPYDLYRGESINLKIQYNFNKNWYLNSGVNYYAYRYPTSYQTIAPSKTTLGSSDFITMNTDVFLGYLEVPIFFGYKTTFTDSKIGLFATVGPALNFPCYTRYKIDYWNNTTGETSTENIYSTEFKTNALSINAGGTIGLSYPLLPELYIHGGINWRMSNIITSYKFTSFGLQIGTTYFFGKVIK